MQKVIIDGASQAGRSIFGNYERLTRHWDQDLSFEVFNSYWSLGAKDRTKYDEKDWKNWLKKHGVKI